jgi:beta-lactam-binding protein with PASTA domain/tRNA A-37 threonylcarbamoyl transferase component Bud32
VGATVTDPLVGHLIDERYEITARIARGGMATVYRAVDRRLEREVALKIMHPHLAEGADVVARFRREARASARLSHPGIVGVYDQGSDGDTAYLALEHVAGPDLRAVLRERGTLPLGEALDVVEAVLDALAAAHAAGVVHRDVKPENVLMAAGGRVKVADFGLARAVTEATAATTGTVLGTVAYLPPEVVTSGATDARADVYACGVMLYELLTGHQPLTGETAIRTAYRHVHEDVPAPSLLVPWLPIDVDDAVAALCARDPQERPLDAGAALVLLRRAHLAIDEATLARQAAPPVAEAPAGDDSPPASSPDHEPTRALGLASSTGTAALPLGGVPAPAAEPGTGASGGPTRRRRTVRVLLVAAILALMGAGSWWWFALGPGAYTRVPDVTGLAAQAALAEIENSGLHADVTRAHDDVVPEGLVVSTSPGPGEPVLKDGGVGVVVSLGILMLEVPDLAGRAESDAITALEDAGLVVGTVSRPYDMSVPLGAVISTNPGAGEVIPHNRPVDVVVSNGREPVTVPSVSGAPQADAEQALTDAGLIPEVVTEYSDDVPVGQVISQDPGPGPALRGDSVRLTVSLGPPLVPIPAVVGKQVDEATRILRDAGFDVRIERVLGGFFGTVRASDPTAGTAIPRGSTVTLTIV